MVFTRADGRERGSDLRRAIEGRLVLLRLVPDAGGLLAVAFVAVLLLDAAAPVAFLYASGSLVGAVPEAVVRGELALDQPAARWLAVCAALLVVERMMGPVRNVVTERLGRAIDRRLRERVMQSALAPTGVMHLENPATLDLIELSRGVSTWGGSPGRAVGGLGMILAVRLSGLLALVIVGTFRWWLALLLGAVAWAVLHTKFRLYLQMSSAVIGSADDLRRVRYFRDLVLTPDAAKELRVFGLSPWMRARFSAAWVAAMADTWRDRRRSAPLVLFAMCGRGAAAMVTLVLLGRAGVRQEIDLAAVIVLSQAVSNSAVLSFTLGNPELLVEQGRAAATAAASLDQRLAVVDTHNGELEATGLPASSIVFDRVAFSYPNRERPVFDALDLEIPAGRSLAIVGDNGAGKTTIVKLLTRLFEPTGGRILVDGVDLRDIAPASWHRQVSAIFQDFVRFQLSAEQNVAWGAVHAPPDQVALDRIAALAGIDDVIGRLPHGWETILSRRFEGGADLSGGEWQRIALARALYSVHGGAQVLVLDEPTAQLDVRSEARLYERFLELTHGLTTIVISHRFSTVRRADRIVVIDGGRVVEQGSHDELLATGGRYAEMFRLQAARYVEVADGEPV